MATKYDAFTDLIYVVGEGWFAEDHCNHWRTEIYPEKIDLLTALSLDSVTWTPEPDEEVASR